MRYTDEIASFLISWYQKRLSEAITPEARSFLRKTLFDLKNKYQ